MPTTVTISGKNQIVVPKEARERLKVGPGHKLLVLSKKDRVVLIPQPENFTKKLAGLHKEVWQEIDTAAYLEQERDSWHS